MFTGLIEAIGTTVHLKRQGEAARLTVTAPFPADEISLGDSIAVNGVCLTVVAKGEGAYTFDVSPETLNLTTFRNVGTGSRVNLERALRFSDRLGGHLVSGHVDCVGTVASRRELAGNILFSFRVPVEHAAFLVAKGSVTIDGISLTVNTVTGDCFTVNVIPHTAGATTLEQRRQGDEVNIETDLIGKYVARFLAVPKAGQGGMTLETLAKSGFL